MEKRSPFGFFEIC